MAEHNDPQDWRPAVDLGVGRARARMLATVRAFFAEREVLEVETPALSAACTLEPHLESLSTRYRGAGAPPGGRLFLHTSPEYPMKRLLAAGWGSIYQICKVFRDGEAGRLHNPEFTLLEWYRPGFDQHQLMDELGDLVARVLGECAPPAAPEKLSYREAVRLATGLDPLRATPQELRGYALAEGFAPAGREDSGRDFWLDLILVHQVEPGLGRQRLSFVYDYPASQASLARVRREPEPVAERFELYLEGIELANGFAELTDAAELARRMERDRSARERLGLGAAVPDRRLLAALEHGLPPCAGVALGLDRLLMLALGASALREVIAFPIDRA